MNGVHDMGGQQNFGRVPTPIADEAPFGEHWESRVFAMQMATLKRGIWKPGFMRASMEAIPPAAYLSASYYERWELGLEARMLASGVIFGDGASAASLSAEAQLRTMAPPAQPGSARPAVMGTEPAAAFRVGQRVRARNLNPPTHTRLPRYARTHLGVISALRGVQSLPDLHVATDQEVFQWVYGVLFDARELWGPEADSNAKVSIDAWEAYLEPSDE